jgi:hypothetical protein
VAIGQEALVGSGANIGSSNVAIGYRALNGINTADSCIGIGAFAGKYANASRQVFIDSGGDRTNLANEQNIGLIYGEGQSTAVAQKLNFNALVRIGAGTTVASLPAASAAYTGYKYFVTDSTVAMAGNFGATVVGGNSNVVPVFCTGTAWVIG